MRICIAAGCFDRPILGRHYCDNCRTANPKLGSWRTDPVVDDVAVDAAVQGHPVRLTIAERREVVKRWSKAGESAREIGERLGVSQRMIQRDRQHLGIDLRQAA